MTLTWRCRHCLAYSPIPETGISAPCQKCGRKICDPNVYWRRIRPPSEIPGGQKKRRNT